MENPEKTLSLKKGVTYKLCTCGTSQTVPYCDQSHERINAEKNCSYKSLKITPKEDITLNVTSKNWEKV